MTKSLSIKGGGGVFIVPATRIIRL